MENPTVHQMVTIERYAEEHNVAVRTVRRYLEQGKIDGVDKQGGRWLIPLHAEPRLGGPGKPKPSGTDVAARAQGSTAVAPPDALFEMPTMRQALAKFPVMVPLDKATHIVGISERMMIEHKDFYHLQKHGRGWQMPKYRILELNGPLD